MTDKNKTEQKMTPEELELVKCTLKSHVTTDMVEYYGKECVIVDGAPGTGFHEYTNEETNETQKKPIVTVQFPNKEFAELRLVADSVRAFMKEMGTDRTKWAGAILALTPKNKNTFKWVEADVWRKPGAKE